MQILTIALGGLAAVLAVLALIQHRRSAALKARLAGLEEALERCGARSARTAADSDALLQAANTIHLYAALSAEEAQSRSLKEKQAVILRASGELVSALQSTQ